MLRFGQLVANTGHIRAPPEGMQAAHATLARVAEEARPDQSEPKSVAVHLQVRRQPAQCRRPTAEFIFSMCDDLGVMGAAWLTEATCNLAFNTLLYDCLGDGVTNTRRGA